MSKAESIMTLNSDKNYSSREAKVNHKIFAIKYHSYKWSTRCSFSKSTGEHMIKRIVNAYEKLKRERIALNFGMFNRMKSTSMTTDVTKLAQLL